LRNTPKARRRPSGCGAQSVELGVKRLPLFVGEGRAAKRGDVVGGRRAGADEAQDFGVAGQAAIEGLAIALDQVLAPRDFERDIRLRRRPSLNFSQPSLDALLLDTAMNRIA